MCQNDWVRVAQLFGVAFRGLKRRARILLKLGTVVATVIIEEVLRRFIAPIIDIILPTGGATAILAAVALGILLYLRRN